MIECNYCSLEAKIAAAITWLGKIYPFWKPKTSPMDPTTIKKTFLAPNNVTGSGCWSFNSHNMDKCQFVNCAVLTELL